MSAADLLAHLRAVPHDPKLSFEALADCCAHAPQPLELADHIAGLKELEFTEGFYGPYAEAARIMVSARLVVLDKAMGELRAMWRHNLDVLLKNNDDLPWDALTPEHGPQIYEALCLLEGAPNANPNAYGELLEQARQARLDLMERMRFALAKIGLMVFDPASVPDDFNGDVDKLAAACEQFERLEPKLAEFNGDEAMFEKAKALKLESVAKQKRLLEKVRAQRDARLLREAEGGIDRRDEAEHRHHMQDAAMTAEDKTRRLQRAIEAAEPMFLLLRRITEIAHMDESNHVGTIDANGLLDVVQRAHAMVLRVEGRLN